MMCRKSSESTVAAPSSGLNNKEGLIAVLFIILDQQPSGTSLTLSRQCFFQLYCDVLNSVLIEERLEQS